MMNRQTATKLRIAILAVCATLAIASANTYGYQYQVTQLAANSGGVDDVVIGNGGQVAWRAKVDGDWEVFYYDGVSVSQLTHSDIQDSAQLQMNTHGALSWRGEKYSLVDGVGFNDYETFLFDGSTISQLSGDQRDGSYGPRINDQGQVAWEGLYDPDGNGGFPASTEVYFYNGSEVARLTDHSNLPYNPYLKLTGLNDLGQIVWQEAPDGHDSEIFMYDGSQIRQITDNSVTDGSATINDSGHIAWASGQAILRYDGVNTKRVYVSYRGSYPLINNHGDIAWTERAGDGTEDIFFLDADAATEDENFIYGAAQLTYGPLREFLYDLNERGDIAWHVERGSDYEVQVYEEGSLLYDTGNDINDFEPCLNDRGDIAWKSYDSDGSYVMLAIRVPEPSTLVLLLLGTLSLSTAENVHRRRHQKL